MSTTSLQNDGDNISDETVTILARGSHYVIVNKPPSVLCHHDSWAGSRKKKLKAGEKPEPNPMLQRVRDVIANIDSANNVMAKTCCEGENKALKRRVNLVHRLDRGVSGALLFAFAEDESSEEQTTEIIEPRNDFKNESFLGESDCNNNSQNSMKKKKGATATLQEEMRKPTAVKTYVALVRGEGILRGEDLKQKGWFEVNRPIKNAKGSVKDATTLFRFVSGQAQDDTDEQSQITRPRISLVLARPQQGRWHQIRKHLSSLSHHILGDRLHGCSKTNKEWKTKRNMKSERVFLHLARLEMAPTIFTPNGIDCSCTLPEDMLDILSNYAPDVLNEALPILGSEGILINEAENNHVKRSNSFPDAL